MFEKDFYAVLYRSSLLKIDDALIANSKFTKSFHCHISHEK